MATPTSRILVDVQGVSASRPDRPLFASLDLTLAAGDRVGLVGINGTGKTTLLNVLAGRVEPETGTVRRGRDLTVGYLDQEPVLPEGTVAEAIGDQWRAKALLEKLDMGDFANADTATLSGGQRKRVALAQVLYQEPELLLMDEPTNHLDLPGVAWLAEQLNARRGGLLLVTHDRWLLDAVTSRTVELDRGASYVHEGGYAGYLEGRAKREEDAQRAEDVRRNLARKELAFLQRGVRARRRKAKSRVREATAIVEGRPQAAARGGDLCLGEFGTRRLGRTTIELEGVGFAHSGSAPLFSGLDLWLDPRERLGIVGGNGTGKSTLLDIIAGVRQPTSGSVERGRTVHVSYLDQMGRELDPQLRVREAVVGPHRKADFRDAALLERFWFDKDAQFARIETLSGGERRRLQLLLVLAERPNVLLLDEPSNDLDLDTLWALESELDSFEGAVVIVSHDRALLERVTSRVLVVEDGFAHNLPGGIDGWDAHEATRYKPQPDAKPKATKKASNKRRRSPTHLARLIQKAETDMARLEQRKQHIGSELSKAGVGHEALAELGAELARVGSELAEVEEQWMKLSEEAEE
ncbi:MAG: ABC-F family ATP-binding cassette domain-containing protein [Acidimicrobiales bacterium]